MQVNISKIVFLHRNGAWHFAVEELGDGTRLKSLLDLANSLPTQIEDGEHFNSLILKPGLDFTDLAFQSTLTVFVPSTISDAGAYALGLEAALGLEFSFFVDSDFSFTVVLRGPGGELITP